MASRSGRYTAARSTAHKHTRWRSLAQKTGILLGALFALGALLWVGIYIGTAYWQAQQFKQHLLDADSQYLTQHIQPYHLAPYHAHTQITTAMPNADGARYLYQVWSHVAQQQDVYQLLLLQVELNQQHASSRMHFVSFPSTFRLTWGKGDQQLWFEWQRSSWRTWQFTALCVYNPHPVDEPKSCASSKR